MFGGPYKVLMSALYDKWPNQAQQTFLKRRYLERMKHARRLSSVSRGGTTSGRFIVGAASLAPTLTAAGAVSNSGVAFWLKIVGIGLGALVAIATAMLVAIRASGTWAIYHDLRVELETLGWRAQSGGGEMSWKTFTTGVSKAVNKAANRYSTDVVRDATAHPGAA